MRHLIYFATASLTLFYTAYFVLNIVAFFVCTKSSFHLTEYCVYYPQFYDAQAVFSVVIDLFILCLPIWSIFKLRVSRKKKIWLLAVLMTGSLWVSRVMI